MCSEDEDSRFLQKYGICPSNYRASHLRRSCFSCLIMCELVSFIFNFTVSILSTHLDSVRILRFEVCVRLRF